MGRPKGWWDGGTVGTGGHGGSGYCSVAVAVAVVIVFLFGSDSDVLISGWLGLFYQSGPTISITVDFARL